MRRAPPDALQLGAAVVQRLLPHRPPLLLVDRIEAFTAAAPPRLRASRCFTANEPLLAGHFPGLPIVPGALLLEGLAQAAALLWILVERTRARAAAGGDPGEVLEALRALDRGYRLDPSYRAGAGEEALGGVEARRIGLLAGSEIRFVHPVFPGEPVRYEVTLERELEGLGRFEVEAAAGSQAAARGTLTLARVERPIPL